MATKRSPGSRADLVHCDVCGEDYSATYRRCPFCNGKREEEYEPLCEEEEYAEEKRGGKRLAQGGGVSVLRIISILLSLIIIFAAVWVVLSLVHRDGSGNTADSEASQNVSQLPAESSPSTSYNYIAPSAAPSDLPGTGEADPTPETSDEPAVSDAPPEQATSLSISKEDVTLSSKGEVWRPTITFSPSGTTGTVTWESDNPDIASVSADGAVTAVSPGTTSITAMLPNGATVAAIVRCVWTTSTPAPTPSPASTAYATNNPDFTFSHAGETFRLRVPGYDGGVTWSSSNTDVVAVASDGTCTAVGNGVCTVTGTLDNGATVQTIARCSLS